MSSIYCVIVGTGSDELRARDRAPLEDVLVTKQKILELALKYNLSSKHTSWVAIDSESQQRFFHDELVKERPAPAMACASPVMPCPPPASAFGVRGAPARARGPPARGGRGAPGTGPPVSAFGRRGLPARGPPASAIGGLGASVSASMVDMACAPPASAFGGESLKQKKSSPELSSRDPHARLRSVLQHQQFDGLFSLNSAIAALFSTTVKQLQEKLVELQKAKHGVELSETVWMTCLAVELMRKQLPELQEEWELVVEKAEKRVAGLVKNAEDLAALQQAASDMLQATFKGN